MRPDVLSGWIAFSVVVLALFTVRKRRLRPNYGIWWALIGILLLLGGFLPTMVDMLGHSLGIAYPPILPIIIGLCLVFLKLLSNDLELSEQEVKVRVLAQKLALLEGEIERERAKNAQAGK